MIERQLENSLMVDLKVEVAMLKKEVSFINILFEKMDVVITKIDTQHDLLIDKTSRVESTMSFTKEELSNLYLAIEKTEREISDRINSIERLLSAEIKSNNIELSDRLEKQEEITNGLGNIKIIIFGALAIVTFISTNIEFIKKLFS